ncbi:hypothetical protein Hanom_Chr04g00353451 [Helianthus anomalus]
MQTELKLIIGFVSNPRLPILLYVFHCCLYMKAVWMHAYTVEMRISILPIIHKSKLVY